MKKYTIGFNENKNGKYFMRRKQPRKSIVKVYFPHRGMGWTYYNDSFDLKVGDLVYVEGKLEGYRGRVTEVNYSFKIKLSDYKKVIGVIDTNVKGDFYLAGLYLASFDKRTIPYSKVLAWFKAPEKDAVYVRGNDNTARFPLNDLSEMDIDYSDTDCRYHTGAAVMYLELDGVRGRAIVEGSEFYEIEFCYCNGEISNIKCSCFCSGICRHDYIAMIQLRETLEFITENYENKFGGYFAVIDKNVFMDTAITPKSTGKISLGV